MVTRRVARVWPGNNVSNILVNLRCCTGPFSMEDMRLFPDMRILYVLSGWIVRITYDAFPASKIHRSDPRSTDSETTWASHSSSSQLTERGPLGFGPMQFVDEFHHFLQKTNSHMYVPYCEQHPRFTKKRLGVLLPTASVIDPLVRQWKI